MRACEFTHLNIKSVVNVTSHCAARRAPQQLTTRWYAIYKNMKIDKNAFEYAT